MKKILLVLLIFFIAPASLIFSSENLKSIPWEQLPDRVAKMNSEFLAVNVENCPIDLDMEGDHTVVIQWIENTFYKWQEYAIGGDSICIVMKKPKVKKLTKEESQVLLKASTLWMEEKESNYSNAIILDKSDLSLSRTPVQYVPKANASFDKLIPNESVSSPVNTENDQDISSPTARQTIIGDDDRVETTTESYPWNTIAYVEFAKDGIYYRGTAFLVSPFVALTGGHIVYDYEAGSFYSAVKIYPGLYETGDSIVQPYGNRSSTQLYTNTLYAAYGDVSYDFGAIMFSTPFSDISTFMPLKFDFDLDNSNTILNTSGYPAEAQGAYTYSQWFDYDYSSNLSTDSVARYYMDVTGGSSGSPVWLYSTSTDNRYVVAINSAEWEEEGFPNGGPRLTSSNQDLIESWVDWTPPAYYGTYEVEIGFDPEFYLYKYSDLVTAGYSKENVKDHWLTNGIYEGRQGSETFDVNYYLQKYPDLQQAFGNDYYAAFTHWLNNGIYEGRQGSETFDPIFYLQNYPDLQQAFGNDYYLALSHWIYFGVYEGRQGI
jgi:V8-like Glu-specific endopeptidase